MTSTSRSRLLLVVGLVLAFTLGSIGSATAAGLSKGAVKKIAAKVVAQKASSLSVLNAKTADSAKTAATAANAQTAATLGGSTAADLKTKGYLYNLPAQGSASSRTYTFPGLPAGTYLISYDMTMSVSSSSAMTACQMHFNNSSAAFITSYGPSLGGIGTGSRCTSSGIATTTGLVDLVVAAGSDTFSVVAGADSSVSFIPIDTLTTVVANGAKGD